MLCFTAGMVNAAGFFAFAVLTTNVTGHAALLAHELALGEFRAARMIALWLFLFLAGAFFTAWCIDKTKANKSYTYTIPIIAEMCILLLTAIFGYTYDHSIIKTEYFAGSLLFAMGMQNALVSKISGSVVRTTHLTGMFTDLGIDLYTWFSIAAKTAELKQKIALRLTIILFFLAGGITGGYAFITLKYHTFYLPAGILAFTIWYDISRLRIRKLLRYLSTKNST
nr:YoaK family protein [Chitinophaga sp. Cy-1792]